MKVSELTAHLKKQFKINAEIVLTVDTQQKTYPKLTLEHSGIKEGVKIVIDEILKAQPKKFSFLVKSTTGDKTFTMKDINENMLIKELRELIGGLTGISVNKLILVKAGTVLKDDS
jgi:hypothetical protein